MPAVGSVAPFAIQSAFSIPMRCSMRGIARSSLSMLSMNRQAEWARRALALAAFAAVSASSGCNGGAGNAILAQAAECSVPVIVSFMTAPNAASLADIARTNALELDPLGAITNDVRAYTLRASGSDDCAEAIARLRRDDRVRSVDIDARREAHEP